MVTLLLACALAQTAHTPPISNLPPVDALVRRTIWPELFDELFAAPYDVFTWQLYPLDAPFNSGTPATYYGRNHYGQPYALHVRKISDLGDAGRLVPSLTFWGVDVGAESTLALRETRGLIVTVASNAPAPSAYYIPAAWWDHYPPADAEHDCTPPAIPPDLCDPAPDCDHGAVKYLDAFCAEITGGTYRIACELAWDVYAGFMEAADENYQACSDSAFGVAGICLAGAAASGFIPPTFGLNTLVVTLACVAHLDNSLATCSKALHAAETLAWNNRNSALTAAAATFNNNIKLCCKDCAGHVPPAEQKGGPKKK